MDDKLRYGISCFLIEVRYAASDTSRFSRDGCFIFFSGQLIFTDNDNPTFSHALEIFKVEFSTSQVLPFVATPSGTRFGTPYLITLNPGHIVMID